MEPSSKVGYKVVFVTSKREEAEKIAQQVIEKKLAACANIIEKIKSLYWWKNKIEKDDEALIIFKTNYRKVTQLINKIKEIHSYEVPEIIVLDIETGNNDYLKWITEVLM